MLIALDHYLAFSAAAAALIATPGPMVALIFANSLERGLRGGIATVAGSAASMVIQLSLVTAGLAAVLARVGDFVFWIKWAGAAYLFVLGVQSLLKRPAAPGAPSSGGKSVRRMFTESFALSMTHPKSLLFYVAFFPAFLDPARPATPQLALLSATFFAISICGDSLWALAAAGARGAVRRAGRWPDVISGVVMIAAGAGLALMERG